MNTRNYRVRGVIICLYTPGTISTPKLISGIDVELWAKTPLEVIFLGKSLTDDSGIFVTDFHIDSPIEYIVDGKIENAFIKTYFNGVLINESDPISGLILNEGFTDLGNHEINITSIEEVIRTDQKKSITDFFPESNTVLFKLRYDLGQDIPYDLSAVFNIYNAEGAIELETTLNPNKDGFIQLNTPLLPLVVIHSDTVINYLVEGPLDRRDEENYLELSDGVNPNIYTLISNIVIQDNLLQIKDGSGFYHKILPSIAISPETVAVYINKNGQIYGYTTLTSEWLSVGTLTFSRFEFPINLTVISDGFYLPSATSGTITTGTLGSIGTPFEEFFGTVTNPEPFLLKVGLSVFNSDGGGLPPVFSSDFIVTPGSPNFIPVLLGGSPPSAIDHSPSIAEIQIVSGVTFSPAFEDFLNTRSLTTTDKIRKAGPITYINGFSGAGIGTIEAATLQTHVDLYSINNDISQNQQLLNDGYGNLFAIANTPKNLFLDDVVDASLPLFKAAQIHEIATQNQKLVGNLLAGTLTDLKLANPSTPVLPDSNFVYTSLANNLNSCGCDDCKSGISPFAYLMDLMKYAAAHVHHNIAPIYNPGNPVDYTSFITLLQNKFLQPFGTLNVDCDTLHTEFCRVRLVTEVLEKWLDFRILNGQVPPSVIQLQALTKERQQFLELVYRSILTQAGSSLEELRNVVITTPTSDKIKAAQKLVDKLEIPLYVPSTSILTVDRIWLTSTNINPLQVLNAVNLETVFGFRDTKRNVLTVTPLSLVEQWRATQSRSQWKEEDYKFTNYSREGVIAASDPSFKTNWKPIIDPDIIGWIDFTYLNDTTLYPGSNFSKELWKHRKIDTDSFLKYCLTNNSNTSRTSVDFNNRILRVLDRDIVTHVLEGDIIQIERPANTWNNFNVLNRTLNLTNTDVILKKTTPIQVQPPMLKPIGANPKMRYKRVVNVISGTTSGPGTTITITWPSPVILDRLTGGYAKLESTTGASPYQTSPPGVTPLLITGVNVVNSQQVILSFGTSGPDATFLAGTVKFVYEVEVPLDTNLILDPAKISEELFNTNQSYTLLPTAPISLLNPLPYKVWDTPIWPGIITATTNYGRLKQMFQFLSAGTLINDFTTIINDSLHTTVAAFNQMMLLMIKCENYLGSMYTYTPPTEGELYELASIYRNCAKTPLRDTWVKEEIRHLDLASNPISLQLSGQFFWKAIAEPIKGSWDPSLQTIPSTVGAINAFHKAIIDPEILVANELNDNPEAKPYRDLYNSRKLILEAKFNFYTGLTQAPVFDVNAFTKILNEINTGLIGNPYNISPYPTLAALQSDLESTDLFKQKTASDVLWSSFRLTREDFLEITPIKSAYELNNPLQFPTGGQIDKAVKLLVSAYKRNRLYNSFVSPPFTGWIKEEINGSYTTPVLPVFYYNVIKMNMAPGRSDVSSRDEWQQTLAAWNRQPFVQPDIVPPENIKNFVVSNPVYTLWSTRKTALINDYATIALVFNSTLNAGPLFANLKNQLNLIVARVANFVNLPLDYLAYFTDIKDKESNGEDIRPYIFQLGMTVVEYRFLAQIYKVLENENIIAPGAPSSLIESEYIDVIDILIDIRSNNLSFLKVQAEYNGNILLDQDYFQIYKPTFNNFPLTDLPNYNKWRSPYLARREWLNKLQTRIDSEQGVKDHWKDVLQEAEDRNMPLMRDALIRALVNNCESFQDACERLAKTFFIETKDNCCVKHTRVSFAIETVQGLVYSLETGIYDDFVSNFSLTAPQFKQEWQWIGSYATWRSAMFVFLYPENLLYPTLKRNQSSAFVQVSKTIQNANRFSPEDACKLASEYQDYLHDIESLEIICSTNARTNSFIENINACCNEDNTQFKFITYFFGQSKSGKSYMSSKETENNSKDALSFWNLLPIGRENVKLIGCYALGARGGPSWGPIKLSLFLFYSFIDDGKLKMAYISKDLFDAGSKWADEKIMGDVPFYPDTNIYPFQIIPCQQRMDWESPLFIMSYQVNIPPACTNFPFLYNLSENKFDTIPPQDKGVIGTLLKPNTAIYQLVKDTNTTDNVGLVSFITDNRIYFRCLFNEKNLLGNANFDGTYGGSFYFHKIIGVYDNRDEENTLIVVYKSYNNPQVLVRKIKITYYPNFLYFDDSAVTPDSIVGNLQNIYPIFSEYHAPLNFAIKAYASNSFLFTKISAITAQPIAVTNLYQLAPQKIVDVSIQSADCIGDMNLRLSSIIAKFNGNYNSPIGSISTQSFYESTAIKDLLFEAYYFVPMLLALDQQKRGQFDSALSWYRSIYDYTNPIIAKRKIFYGLVLEENILSTFVLAPNWLLDPLNPHLIAQTRTRAYSKYTLMNIIQCMNAFADREFTLDTIETVPIARKWYTTALDLLKTKDLEIKSNLCNVSSNDCLDVKTDILTDPTWSNQFNRVKSNLNAIGDAVIIESLTDPIVVLINSGTEATFPEKFAQIFQMIESATPAPAPVETVLDVVSGFENRMNDAYRYLSAFNNSVDFNSEVSQMYASSVAAISGLSVETINTPEAASKLTWLMESVPTNNNNYQFKFADSAGTQFLSGSLAYNPLSPTNEAYNANIGFSNAPAIIGNQQTGFPVNYTPLLDYKFCTPQNPVFNALGLKGNLELYKIFNCRNIAGMVRELSVFSATTDSVSGIPIIGSSGNLITPGINNYTPSQYRFRVLIERAKQIAQQAQQMESLFLAALEKEDAENYSQLRARQDLETAKGTIKLQDLRISQANDERGIADIQLGKVTFIQSHFNDLLAQGQNEFELKGLELLEQSINFLQGAIVAQSVAAGFYIASGFLSLTTENLTGRQGSAFGSFGSAASSIAGALSTQSSILSIQSSIAAQMASFQRRSQEWEFQSQLAGFDISLANQQVKVADDNVRIVTQERQIAVLNSDHAQVALDFIKNKFTNAELYNFMGNVLERSYSYMLNLSTAIARTAENQLYFERQEQAGPFILDDYWETPSSGFTSGSSGSAIDRRGLTGSARLAVDITRLDQYAFDTAKRKLQLTKVISLAQNFPSEFQQFKQTGVFNFELTNRFFDYDFPGHYLRLINSVRTSVVGLLPVYDQIKATLTAGSTSYTVIGGTTFQKIPIKRLELDSIALTGASNANGLFELQPTQGELLNPFEGMGIESRWEFKMPQFSNRVDYSNIADVLITVEYTAFDSFQYRAQVLQDIDNALSFNRGFSFKNNFPDQWYELGEVQSGPSTFAVTIQLKREFYPQGILDLQLNGTDLVLFFVRNDGFEDEIEDIDFTLANPISTNATKATVNGVLSTNISNLNNSPVMDLTLTFDNNFTNRELFTAGNVTDILLLVGCKAELKAYPL